MKRILKYIIVFASINAFASNTNICGGGDYWEGMFFYNLFSQTNISAEEFYPFLRDESSTFYGEGYYTEDKKDTYPKGNTLLWNELLVNWSTTEIENALYKPTNFNWTDKNSAIENRAKLYIEFAQLCSDIYGHRNKTHSWDYDEITAQKTIDPSIVLTKATTLLSTEKNPQLKARYYYQIIRILHYSQNWQEAINFYEATIDGKLPKDELYYYILDQLAGCYYSIGKYDKAAYLFTKVMNNSLDRKKSAFLSFNFCTHHNAEGKPFFKSKEDEKDLLLITSLRNFSDEISNIQKFVQLDANDNRIELLFMRALSNVEREVWPKEIGVGDSTLPSYNNTTNYKQLLVIADKQRENTTVKNTDFWQIASSYLSFIKQDIATAKIKLNEVQSFKDQKKELSIIYEIFSLSTISSENEEFLFKAINDYPKDSDLRQFILNKIAHTYYKNGEIAKTFLVHNSLNQLTNLNSLVLFEALEAFYYKPNKSAFEEFLISSSQNKNNFIDQLNYQKGVYFLYQKNTGLAMEHFNKNKSYSTTLAISNAIFSNNIKECFECPESIMMDDEVYKASLFSFIEPQFSTKELTSYLIELEKLTTNEKQWKRKLANYLLANYYYNISNTGYYRGALISEGNCCNYNYINYEQDSQNQTGEEIIANNKGYNLADIEFYDTRYFGLSDTSKKYYQAVLNESTDKELNARCLYIMAKCELNDYYNNGSNNTFEVYLNEYQNLELPVYESFKLLKEEYSDTKFHELIIKECSYFKMYSDHY